MRIKGVKQKYITGTIGLKKLINTSKQYLVIATTLLLALKRSLIKHKFFIIYNRASLMSLLHGSFIREGVT